MAEDHLEDEATRLRRVYHAYAADEETRVRWDPEQPGNRLILSERDGLLRKAVRDARSARTAPEGPWSVIDLGCGDGHVLASLLDADEASTFGLGIDLLESRLQRARTAYPALPLVAANGSALPLADSCVDLMVVFTVFSSILDPVTSRRVATEITRVVEPGGRVIWYDLRRDNPRNREVRGLSAPDVAALFPGWSISLRRCTVLPPLARRTARLAPRSYGLLRRVPFLQSHLFGVLRAPATPGPPEAH